MGSFAITTGVVFVKSRPEVERIVEELRDLADGMDERDVVCEPADVKKYGPGVVRVEINVYGHASASTSTLIEDKVQELGPYAIEAARFHTEWEGESSCMYVGNEAQVAKAESADALEYIKQWAPRLQGEDLDAATCYLMQFAQAPDRNTQADRKGDSENDKSDAGCPHCNGRLECHPDQDGSCDWHCTRCSWHQHVPGNVDSVTAPDQRNESNAKSKRLIGSALPGIGSVDLELLKQQAAILGKVMDNTPLANDERTCLQGLWEFVHRVADHLESNAKGGDAYRK